MKRMRSLFSTTRGATFPTVAPLALAGADRRRRPRSREATIFALAHVVTEERRLAFPHAYSARDADAGRPVRGVARGLDGAAGWYVVGAAAGAGGEPLPSA